jgi:hypothetical protein
VTNVSSSDGGRGGGEGNVYHGPWPERAPRATKIEPNTSAASTNWMRDADAITGGLVENTAGHAPDEFFDQLPSTADTHADDDDLDAFITRQAATTAPTGAQTPVIDGTAALPSDLRLTKRQRRIRVNSISLPVVRSGVARRKSRVKRERRRRTVKQALVTCALIGVLTGIGTVASGTLSASHPERTTLADRRPTTVAAGSHSTVTHAPVRTRTAPTKQTRAAKTSHRVHPQSHKSRQGQKHSTVPRAATQSGQAVAYVQKPAATTPSIVEAATSSTVSSEPAAVSATADHATHSGPTGAGAPFAPGAQVK